MKSRIKAPFSAAIAIGVGIVVLTGYFWGMYIDQSPNLLGVLRTSLVDVAVVLAGVTLLIGIVNLISVHAAKMQKGENEFFSFVLIASLVLTLLTGAYDMLNAYFLGKPNMQGTLWIFDNIQLPIEMSLMAVLTVSLTYALVRLLRYRITFMKAVFSGVVFLMIVGMIPVVVSKAGALADLRLWIVQVLSIGGARGVLLGVALGTVATGIRILIGGERPYGGG